MPVMKRKSGDGMVKTGAQSKKKKDARPTGGGDIALVDNSTFGTVIKEAGVILKAGNRPNEISASQAVFQRKVSSALKKEIDYEEVVEEFMEGLQKHIDSPVRFKWSLMSMVTSVECEASAHGRQQDSLIRLLLGLDELQPKLINILLEKLVETDKDEDAIFSQGDCTNISMSHLVMNQLRWLGNVVNSQDLVTKIFEMVEVTSLEVQREIIGCLPEIVEDKDHADVGTQLKNLLSENSELTVPILDALSNLYLKSDVLAEVRTSVLQSLPSIDQDALPVAVKFLMQSVNNQDALQVITGLRKNLDFSPSFFPSSSSTPAGARASRGAVGKENRSIEALTLDAIKSSIRFQKSVADAWIKVITEVNTAGGHQVIDVFALLILHSFAQRTKVIEPLFRNKVRSGLFTEVLLQAAFNSYSQILREHFASILSIAEALLRSPECIVRGFACAMYKHAFISFDAYCRQEIIGNLVTHIGRRNPGETDSSIDILADLVESQFEKMHPFAVFVKGFLDYMDNLTLSQIRKLYSTLSILGFRNQEEGGILQDDMFIILRKQLSNINPKYKRMGVIGTIMVVKSLARVRPESSIDESDADGEQSINEEAYTQVINLLKLAQASCAKMPEVHALFLDELSLIMQEGSLNPKVESWIGNWAIEDFETHYIVDMIRGTNPPECIVPTEYRFALDNEIEDPIAVNLVPLVVASMEKGKDKNSIGSPQCLAPIYRLLRLSQIRLNSGDLEPIEATLGCPIIMPQSLLSDKMESLSQQEKEVICASVIFAINWMLETVNAFANQPDPEMRLKVNIRLQNISELRKVLEKCLAATPNFQPTAASFYEEVSAPAVTAVGGKKKPKGRKRKKAGDKDGSDDDENNSKDSTQLDKESQAVNKTMASTQKPDAKSTIVLNQYKNYFRELDISVFNMLKENSIVTDSLDENFLEKYGINSQRLQPEQLEYLLVDLSEKLDHALLTSAPKRRTFLKTKSSKDHCFTQLDSFGTVAIIQGGVKLLATLCDQLETTTAFFEELLVRNDGVVDGPGSRSEMALYMGSCMRLLFQTILSVLSWNGFTVNENMPLLKEAYSILAARYKNSSTQSSFKQLVKQTFMYFERFSNKIPNIRGAVTLLKLLEVTSDRCGAAECEEKITLLCKGFLQQEWLGADGEREKGAEFNEQLGTLIRMYLLHSDSKLECIENIASVGMRELENCEKNGSSETYSTLTRHSYAVYYRTLLSELVDCVKAIDSVKTANKAEVKIEKLLIWNMGVRVFHILVTLIKVFDGRSNLMSVLKYGRQLIEIFLRNGMPLLDSVFKTHCADVQGLLKNLQLSTRTLHHICSHSKTVKDVSLTNQVPAMKRCLEAFVYRVKAMLTVNNCSEAFWVGNLKNRDLQGEEILSQSVSNADENEGTMNDVSEGELEDDDEESETEMETDDGQNKGAATTRTDDSDSGSGGESFSEHF
ncbi:Fanconi anemia group D2 protein-like [Lineus longissimus]|uniref:Fanconi anemia group D2 protein-like n=1 Tax=Lineus longissimus TaxID=88925 RepID=UPI00315D2C5F